MPRAAIPDTTCAICHIHVYRNVKKRKGVTYERRRKAHEHCQVCVENQLEWAERTRIALSDISRWTGLFDDMDTIRSEMKVLKNTQKRDQDVIRNLRDRVAYLEGRRRQKRGERPGLQDLTLGAAFDDPSLLTEMKHLAETARNPVNWIQSFLCTYMDRYCKDPLIYRNGYIILTSVDRYDPANRKTTEKYFPSLKKRIHGIASWMWIPGWNDLRQLIQFHAVVHWNLDGVLIARQTAEGDQEPEVPGRDV